MGETRRKFDKGFGEGAVRLVRETGKPIARVARDLGVNGGMLGNWVAAVRRRRGEGGGALSDDERDEQPGVPLQRGQGAKVIVMSTIPGEAGEPWRIVRLAPGKPRPSRARRR